MKYLNIKITTAADMGKARAAPKAVPQSLAVEEAQTPRELAAAPPLLGLDPLHFVSMACPHLL